MRSCQNGKLFRTRRDPALYQMILEVAPLPIRPGQAAKFEAAFLQAQEIISSMPGYVSHELQRCVERPNEYILFVWWETLEAHEVGFRKSAEYQQWKQLLHHFYEPFPVVSHYQAVPGASTSNPLQGLPR